MPTGPIYKPNKSTVIGGRGIHVSNINDTYSISVADIPPSWGEITYLLKYTDGGDVGLFKGVIDQHKTPSFALYQPDKPEHKRFLDLDYRILEPVDFDTHIAFETLPILVEYRFSPTGILLKFPD